LTNSLINEINFKYPGCRAALGCAVTPVRRSEWGANSADGCLTKGCLFVIDRSVGMYCQKLNSADVQKYVVNQHNLFIY